MTEGIDLTINGRAVHVMEGVSLAAAILNAGEPSRVSLHGEARTPFCGMGICMECRATVDGVPHQRSCQLPCAAGMEVVSE